MHIIKSIQSVRNTIRHLKNKNKSIGFVPTMGALHEGHLSLLRRCRRENDICVLSIFVNPAQFGPKEDFKKYPREMKKDKLLAKKENVDIMWHPSVEEVYPRSFLTFIEVKKLSERLCGQYRPGHFKGVATIVAKLLNVVQPDKMYLGQKDAQQAILLKRMVADLNFPSRIIICPTVRDADGLALSSRNQYLSLKQRQQAPIIYRSLKKVKRIIFSGQKKRSAIIRAISSCIRESSSCRIEYIDCVDTRTLSPMNRLKGTVLIALAVRLGGTRLIDNIIVNVK